MTRFRISPRLKDFDYVGCLAAHLTFVTRGRAPLFLDPDLVQIGRSALDETSNAFNATVRAYCFMPDHVHLLVELAHGESLEEFVKRFKQLSGFRLKRVLGDFAWQVSYYDHILRKEEAIEAVAWYIWDNPVKAGLCETPEEYQFSGPKDVFEGPGLNLSDAEQA